MTEPSFYINNKGLKKESRLEMIYKKLEDIEDLERNKMAYFLSEGKLKAKHIKGLKDALKRIGDKK